MILTKKFDDLQTEKEEKLLKKSLKYMPKLLNVQWDVDISPDGDLIAFTDFSRICIIESSNFEEYMTFDHGMNMPTNVRFDYSGKKLYCCDMNGTLKCFDIDASAMNLEEICNENAHESGIVALDYSLNYIVTGCRDGLVKMFSRSTLEVLHVFEGHDDHIHEIIICPDESVIISGSRDKSIIIWDLNSKEKFSHFNKSSAIWCMKYVPDDFSLIVAFKNGSIEKISIFDGNEILFFYF